MKRFYITDLDHTLLNNKAKLAESSKKKIKLLQKNNIKFTVATARSFNSVKYIFEEINLEYPVIELNGAMLTGFEDEHHFFVNDIEAAAVKDIVKFSKTIGFKPFYTVLEENHSSKLYPPRDKDINAGIQWFIDDRTNNEDPRIIKDKSITFDIDADNKVKFISLTFIDKEEKVLELKNYIENSDNKNKVSMDHFANPYSEGWQWLSVQSAFTKKGIAINKFKEVLNVKDHEIVVFGDNLNDCNMFEVADRSYAVENAKEELKKIATGVIGTNAQDAVLNFILKENNITY